jgi:hypothetical protein
MSDQVTVSSLYGRAKEIKKNNANLSYKEVAGLLAKEFEGKPFPSPAKMTIPEQDRITPEEDWTAGLPVVLRGIQTESWKEVAHGVIICLEQVENYEREWGREDDPVKEWHNREKGITEITEKGVGKWMPEELMAMAKKNTKN